MRCQGGGLGRVPLKAWVFSPSQGGVEFQLALAAGVATLRLLKRATGKVVFCFAGTRKHSNRENI